MTYTGLAHELNIHLLKQTQIYTMHNKALIEEIGI